MLNSLNETLRNWVTDTVSWYRGFPRVHRFLIAGSAVVGAALAAIVFVFLVVWATGGFSPLITSASERNLLAAERAYDGAVRNAKDDGISPENYPPAVSAEANVVVALVDAARTEDAVNAANDLAEHAGENSRALYAVAYAYERSGVEGYTSQVTELYGSAADYIPNEETELARAVLLGYGRALAEDGDLARAHTLLLRAAAVQPASADIYLQAAEAAEGASDWFGAAFAYAAAQQYDPLMVAAEEGFDRIAEAHPRDARRALESPDMPSGNDHGN